MGAWRYEISLLVLKKYFTSERSERVKYFSTLDKKFRFSSRPCHILYLLSISIIIIVIIIIIIVIIIIIIKYVEFISEQFFSKLRDDTSISDKVTKEEIQRNLDRALQRYMDWQQEPEIPPGQDSPEPQDAYREDDEYDREKDEEEDDEEDNEEVEATVETKHEEL